MSADWMALVALAACGRVGFTSSTGVPLSNEKVILIGFQTWKVDDGTVPEIICWVVKITPKYSTYMML